MLFIGDILPGDILLAILFTGDIIDWRYFAWRYFAGDILLAIFLPYTDFYGRRNQEKLCPLLNLIQCAFSIAPPIEIIAYSLQISNKAYFSEA